MNTEREKIEYERGYTDGYKAGFNKACEPIIKAKMLEVAPIPVCIHKDDPTITILVKTVYGNET